jgi:hypothetical protein
MRAWHRGTLADILHTDPARITADLAAAATERRLPPTPESISAWRATAALLHDLALFLQSTDPLLLGWHYFLEFEVPRRSRRIDVAIIAHDIIFLVEGKVGATRFERSAIWQAEQYALDMRDFHEGSRHRTIIPVLVATDAHPLPRAMLVDPSRAVQETQRLASIDFPERIHAAWELAHNSATEPINATLWEDAAYKPTPSIIEAACQLYEEHDAREINLAGAHNLHSTVEGVLDLVRLCRQEGKRGIAFITGAPGSGKTLAGLQVVHEPELMSAGEAAGVFLSGNRPLVEVISKAIEDSAVRTTGRTRGAINREVRTFIQHAYAFRNEYAQHPERVPPEHIILFDEAQRAWDARQVRSWTRGGSVQSEPELFLDIMNRVPDWAVIVALVGSGQEINRGEAGLSEWGRALHEFHPDWLVRASPFVLPGAEVPPGGSLFDLYSSEQPAAEPDDRLHLLMNVRSPRAERLNHWVDALLTLDVATARAALPDSREYPMVLTRSLDAARAWLRDRQDDDQRTGLVASADARRLRAWGLETQTLQREKSWADWFLRQRGDVRGSDHLEIPATNFDCQGLELDWAGVCWGNDFSYNGAASLWQTRRFIGSRWTRANTERSRFMLNGYRVLLTRARRGQVIWVPKPGAGDSTIDAADFDATADLLRSTGVPLLD